MVLFILCCIRMSCNLLQLNFSYAFAYVGQGHRYLNPLYELKTFYPTLSSWYGLLSGPFFYFTYAVSGLAWGIAA